MRNHLRQGCAALCLCLSTLGLAGRVARATVQTARVVAVSSHGRARARGRGSHRVSRRHRPRWLIAGGTAGPFEIEMTAAQIRRVAAEHHLRVRRQRQPMGKHLQQRGRKTVWTTVWITRLTVLQGEHRLLIMDPGDGNQYLFEVFSPWFATAEGAGVGSRFRTLARLYGRGDVSAGGGLISIDFMDNPYLMFIDFYLDGGKQLKPPEEPVNRHGNPPSPAQRAVEEARVHKAERAWQRLAWRRLLEANPRVTSIGISGE